MNIKITEGTTTRYIFNITLIDIFQSAVSNNPSDYYSTDTKQLEMCKIYSDAYPDGLEFSNPDTITKMRQMLKLVDSEFLDITI